MPQPSRALPTTPSANSDAMAGLMKLLRQAHGVQDTPEEAVVRSSAGYNPGDIREILARAVGARPTLPAATLPDATRAAMGPSIPATPLAELINLLRAPLPGPRVARPQPTPDEEEAARVDALVADPGQAVLDQFAATTAPEIQHAQAFPAPDVETQGAGPAMLAAVRQAPENVVQTAVAAAGAPYAAGEAIGERLAARPEEGVLGKVGGAIGDAAATANDYAHQVVEQPQFELPKLVDKFNEATFGGLEPFTTQGPAQDLANVVANPLGAAAAVGNVAGAAKGLSEVDRILPAVGQLAGQAADAIAPDETAIAAAVERMRARAAHNAGKLSANPLPSLPEGDSLAQAIADAGLLGADLIRRGLRGGDEWAGALKAKLDEVTPDGSAWRNIEHHLDRVHVAAQGRGLPGALSSTSAPAPEAGPPPAEVPVTKATETALSGTGGPSGPTSSSGLQKAMTSLRLSLLSSPATDVGNIGGSLSLSLLDTVDHPLAVAFDSIASAFTGERTLALRRPGDYFRGMKAGIGDVPSIMRTGEARFQIPHGEVLSKYDIEPTKFESPMAQTISDIVSRRLEAEDHVFWRASFEQAIGEAANLMAMKAADNPRARKAAAAAFAADPTDAMVYRAALEADRMTFRTPNELSSAVTGSQRSWLQRSEAGREAGRILKSGVHKGEKITDLKRRQLEEEARRGHRAGTLYGVSSVVAPFVKVPANIAATTLEHTPLGWISEAAQQIGRRDQRRMALALARGTTGSGLVMLGYVLAHNGLARGYSRPGRAYADDTAENGLTGAMPGSVLIAGKWRDISKLAPGGSLVALGATLADRARENHVSRLNRESADREVLGSPGPKGPDTPDTWRDLGAIDAAAAAGQFVADGTFLGDLGDVTRLMEEPTAAGVGRYAGSKAAMAVPSFVGAAARGSDPLERRLSGQGFPDALLNQVQSRIPGARQQLPPRMTAFGDPEASGRGGALGGIQAMLWPIRSRPVQQEAASRELKRLGIIPHTATKEANDVRMSRALGHATREAAAKILQMPGYAQWSDDARRGMLKDAIADARSGAREAEMVRRGPGGMK